MKRTLLLALATAMVFAVAAAAGEEHKDHGKMAMDKSTVTLTGEVLDMYCFMEHPDNGVGADHAKCANSCIERGLPVGFMAKDGTVYLVIGKDHNSANEMVKGWAGKQSQITGTIVEHNGVKAISLASISEVKG